MNKLGKAWGILLGIPLIFFGVGVWWILSDPLTLIQIGTLLVFIILGVGFILWGMLSK